MGSGIVTALINSGITTYLKEISQKFLDAGVERVKANVYSRVKKGKITEEAAQKIMSLLKPTLTYDGWKQVTIYNTFFFSNNNIFIIIIHHSKNKVAL